MGTETWPENSSESVLISIVNEHQGLKLTELVMHATVAISKLGYREPDLVKVLNGLISEAKLLEIEYVLPDMDYRIKSFILPAGTKVKPLE